jgi:hypothetical protein
VSIESRDILLDLDQENSAESAPGRENQQ